MSIDELIAYARMRDNPTPPYDITTTYRCPICRAECDVIYRHRYNGKIVGCDECCAAESPNEAPECYPRG